MASVKGKLILDRSARSKLANSLTSRTRRGWFQKLVASQEAIEKAVTDQDALLVEAFNAGMSYEVISGALGVHSTSIRDRILRVAGRDQGSSEDPQ